MSDERQITHFCGDGCVPPHDELVEDIDWESAEPDNDDEVD